MASQQLTASSPHQFTAHTPSTVTVKNADFITPLPLPTHDHIIRLAIDLNYLWALLRIPAMPITDDDTLFSDPQQGTQLGSSVYDFHFALNTYKQGWADEYVLGRNGVKFSEAMSDILRALFEGEISSELGPNNSNPRFRIDSTKVHNWLSDHVDNPNTDFYTSVFTRVQCEEILKQIVAMGAYKGDGTNDGQVSLDEGSSIGVIVIIKNKNNNESNLNLWLVQTTPLAKSQGQDSKQEQMNRAEGQAQAQGQGQASQNL